MTAEFPPDVRRALLSRSGGMCERCGIRVATEAHHRRPRAMGSTRRPESARLTNALALCESCHRRTESCRREALRGGWLVSQHADPARMVVLYRHRPALLTEEGGVVFLGSQVSM